MATITEEFIAKHPRSLKLFQDAKSLLPSGVTHDIRYLKPFPLYMNNGKGPRKWDVDGNEFVGYVMGHGSLILGHCHPEIVEEINRQVELGTHLGANTEQEMRWARAVKALIPSIEKIRFHSSGTEATLMALRLSRTFTGKTKIIKFINHFHGWHDYVALAAGNYTSPGIPQEIKDTVILLPAGDIDAVERTLKQDTNIAAVILEPTGARGGALPLNFKFLTQLREVTERYRVLLIFDEVITGFRVSPGGAQERFGVTPDLTVLGKILAGGFTGAAVGGRVEIMDLLTFRDDPEWNSQNKIPHPGTFNANPISSAAGSRCLELISSRPINQKAEGSALLLRKGLNEVLRISGSKGFAYGVGASVWVVFGMEYDGDLNFCTAPHDKLLKAITSETTRVFRLAMFNEGVDVMGGYWFILSSTHSEKEIDETVAAFERAVQKMEKEGIV